MCMSMGKPKSVAMPEVATVVPTKAPSLADGTAQQVAAASKRKNAAAGLAQTIMSGNLGAPITNSAKTLLGQ